MTTKQRFGGLVALLLLAAAGCGGDDDAAKAESDGGSATTTDSASEAPADGGAADGGETASTEEIGADVSLCGMLEPSEIDAQFPEAGGFLEGNDFSRLDQCFWTSKTATEVHLGVEPTEVRSWDERLDYGPVEPVAVEGLGDEAYYSGDGLWSVLYVVDGDTAVSLQANYIDGVDGVEQNLVALAQLVLPASDPARCLMPEQMRLRTGSAQGPARRVRQPGLPP